MKIDIPAIRQYFFEKVPIVAAQMIPMRDFRFCRNHLEVIAAIDPMTRSLVVHLETFILAGPEAVIVDIEEQWPQDWWEAVKDRWAPHWFLRRWPVKWKRISVHKNVKTRMCPHLNVKTQGPHVQFLQHGEPAGLKGHWNPQGP